MSVKQGGVLIAGGGQGGGQAVVNMDNITITNNANHEIQTVAKINQNTSSADTPYIYDWVGTLQEYNLQSVGSSHPEWLCYITDDDVGATINDSTITIKQGNVVKGTFTLNQANDGTINLDAGGGSIINIDNSTITENAQQKIQTVATINSNTASGAITNVYDWIGTLQEYNTQNIGHDHPEWVCFVTDDDVGGSTVYTKSEVDTLLNQKSNKATTLTGYGITNAYTKTEVDNIISTTLEALYPVGSLYIGTQATCPLATLITGSTWTLVGQDRVLQGSSSGHSANTTINAGLPNITGEVQVVRDAQSDVANGAFYISSNTAKSARNSDAATFPLLGFSAQNSNSIYGNSNTVQPPAYIANIWRRTA